MGHFYDAGNLDEHFLRPSSSKYVQTKYVLFKLLTATCQASSAKTFSVANIWERPMTSDFPIFRVVMIDSTRFRILLTYLREMSAEIIKT